MEQFDYYPQKPELVEKKSSQNTKKTILSIFLFILTFVLLGASDFTFIFSLILVLLIHELGHFLFMKMFGYSDVKMLFVPFMGAFVQGKKDEYKQKQSLFVVLAGPIPGIIIGLSIFYLGFKWKMDWMNDLAFLFMVLNVINLLPLDPLDGGQVLKLLVKKNQDLFQLIFSFISSLVMIGVGWYFQLWLIVIFGFLMGLRVRMTQRNYSIHKELINEGVNFTLTYKSLSNKDFSKIKEVLINYTPALKTYLNQVGDDDKSIDSIIANQVNNVLVSPVDRNASFVFKFFILIIWISGFIAPFVLINYLGVLKF